MDNTSQAGEANKGFTEGKVGTGPWCRGKSCPEENGKAFQAVVTYMKAQSQKTMSKTE